MNEGRIICLVDDDRHVLSAVSEMLNAAGYYVFAYNNTAEALQFASAESPFLIISDIRMPGENGISFLRHVRDIDHDIPVILMTAYPDMNIAIDAIKHGVFDFMVKPVIKEQVLFMVKRAIRMRELTLAQREYQWRLEGTVRERTYELSEALEGVKLANIETIQMLVKATEFRDDDTASHIRRIGLYSRWIAEALGMDSEFTNTIRYASQMHDVGKISVPDSVLFKGGPLNVEENRLIRRHTLVGAKMFEDAKSGLLTMARNIALCHHENYDGTGYPNGLKGEDIPISARITAMADKYDALRSDRPYRQGYCHCDAVDIIINGDGRTSPVHFDPGVLEFFKSNHKEFEKIFNCNCGSLEKCRIIKDPNGHKATIIIPDKRQND